MKKITLLLLVLLTAVVGAKARTSERVLWTPATASDIILDVFKNSTFRFKENDVIRIYLTAPSTGVSCRLRYSTDGESFSDLEDKGWPWIGSGNPYGEVTLSSDDIAALNVENTKLYFGYNDGKANINKITVFSNETEETLWSDLEFGTSIVNSFVAGDKIKVYCTVPSTGASFKMVYKGKNGDWTEKFLTDWNNGYPWINAGDSYKEISLSEADITELKDNLLYIGANDMLSIDKISLITETAESSTLWSGSTVFNNNWSVAQSVSRQSGAKIGDVIRGTITATAGATVEVCNSSWASFAGGQINIPSGSGAQKFDYEITSADVLESIQNNGLVIKGNAGTLSKIELLTYADSYDAVPLTIGSDGICTYGSSKDLDFSSLDGVTPYYVSATKEGSVTLQSVTTTRSWAGYIVKGTEGTYSVPVAASTPEWVDAFYNLRYSGDYSGNWVYRSAYSGYSGGGDNETKIKEYYRYIFSKDNSGNIGFYKLATDYSRVTTMKEGDNEIGTTVYYHILGAHKAYLETATDITPTEAEARVALVFDDGEITGIQSVRKQTTNDNVYYTLSGQRVAQPTKGLYIVNGKKVVIK